MKMNKCLSGGLVAVLIILSFCPAYAGSPSSKGKKGATNAPMKLYIDTHDRMTGTFPASMTSAQLNAFYMNYAKVCEQQGVVIVRTYVSQEDGKVFCLNMAPSESAIERVHDELNFPYDGITEVHGVAPTDLLLNEQ